MPALSLPLDRYISDPRLLPLADKVLRRERLSFEDGLLLYESPDLTGIGAMAHYVRLKLHGRNTYYVVSRRLSYTNICYTHCQFCAFQAKPGDPRAYSLSAEDIIGELEKPENAGVRELHMTSGHNPKLKIDYIEDLFGKIKARFPSIHLKVFTMVEMLRALGATVDFADDVLRIEPGVAKVAERVRSGKLGLVVLHSAMTSKLLRSLLSCTGESKGGWDHDLQVCADMAIERVEARAQHTPIRRRHGRRTPRVVAHDRRGPQGAVRRGRERAHEDRRVRPCQLQDVDVA